MEENASNALVIVGGVLISVMLLSLAVYTFQGTASFSKDYEQSVTDLNVMSFNKQFEAYKAKKTVSIQDIVSVANLAHQINVDNGVEENVESIYHVIVKIDTSYSHGDHPRNELNNLEKLSVGEIIKLMSDVNKDVDEYGDEKKPPEFVCKNIDYDSTTGKVTSIVFKKK